jgi:hypothetical protein
VAEDLRAEFRDALMIFGASKCRAVPILINMGRGPMVTVMDQVISPVALTKIDV